MLFQVSTPSKCTWPIRMCTRCQTLRFVLQSLILQHNVLPHHFTVAPFSLFLLPQLYEAFSFLKQLGAVVLVHAENGDLIAQVSVT